MTKIDEKQLAKDLKEAAEWLADNKEIGGCYRFHTVEIDDKGINKNVSIVLGWQEGYDKENDKYCDDGYRLCVKVGYQPVNSMTQCDYDIDFYQVYDKETGDVYDTEIDLYPNTDFENVARTIIADFQYVISSWKEWGHD